MSKGGGCKCIRTLTKHRWYSEAETMDDEELSRRKSLEGVDGSPKNPVAVERSLNLRPERLYKIAMSSDCRG
jgi:hypothetical protein